MVPVILIQGNVAGAGKSPGSQGEKGKDGASVAASVNGFAADLFGELAEKKGNLFLSPFSISTALDMTLAGARGETSVQMKKVLHAEKNGDDLHKAVGKLVKDLNAAGKKNVKLSVANALWVQKSFKIESAFSALLDKHYKAGLREVDFAGSSETARKTINAWVEDETQKKIKDLLKPGIIDGMTRLVLTNAIYFKGTWKLTFKKEDTHDAPFTVAAGKTVETKMMHRKGSFRTGWTDTMQILELPYAGGDLSMIVLLPNEADGLPALEKALTAEKIDAAVAGLQEREADVFLPKFTMTTEFVLNDPLVELGMKDAFDAGAADFSGIDGQKDLFISAVVHKAFVDVNEEGTEAAAATAVVIGITCVKQEPVFRADHPFLFIIRDNASGAWLFMGRVADPTA